MNNHEMAKHSKRCQVVAALVIAIGNCLLVWSIYRSFGWGILGSLFLIFLATIIWKHYRYIRHYYESLFPSKSQEKSR